MPETIEGKARELLEGANFCHVATLWKSGRSLINPIWIHTDGEQIAVNSAEGRQWPASRSG